MGAIITLIATASAVARWSVIALVILGALALSKGVYDLGWMKAPHQLGAPLKAGAIFILIWGGMIYLGKTVSEPRHPELSGYIGNVTFGPSGENNQDVFMVIEAVIKNNGAPSSIDNIGADITLHSGRRVSLIALPPPKEGINAVDLNGAKKWFPTTKYLPHLGTSSIRSGGMLAGWIFALAKGVTPKEITDLPIVVELSCDDVTGQRITLKTELTRRVEQIDPTRLQEHSHAPELTPQR